MMAYTREENMPETHVRKMFLNMDRLRDDIIKDRIYIEGSEKGIHPNADSWEKGNTKLLLKLVDFNSNSNSNSSNNNSEMKPTIPKDVVFDLKKE